VKVSFKVPPASSRREAGSTVTGAPWRDLNDRHFAFGQPAGWMLQAAVAINSGGTIAGTGVNSAGQTRGFLLVPRTAGQ